MNKQNKAFSLVELVVVVAILALLWTIWFVSYAWYLVWIRDTNRIATLISLWEWLDSYKVNYALPLPDDYVEIKVWWNIIAYQWYIWESILKAIDFSSEWNDPKDKIYYSYYLTKENNHFQIMWFLENSDNEDALWVFDENATIDYSIRYPSVYWEELGILTWSWNIPIQEIDSIISAWKIELDTTSSWTVYRAHINDWRIYTFSWKVLVNKLLTLSEPWIYGPPGDCPRWFIPVWWDAGFNQEWFCVAKYEMSYNIFTWFTWGWPDSNSITYDSWKYPVSKLWKYPIANLTEQEAINSCKSLWKWYHILLNSEYMSLARQVEFEANNWSSWEVLNWFIYNWVSWDTVKGCDKTWWNIETYTYWTKTWPWNNDCDSKRELILFNWQKVWDLAWNVNEYVNKANTLDWSWFDTWQTSIVSYISGGGDYGDMDEDGIYNSIDMNKYGSIFYLWVDNGMWTIQDWDWATDNVLLRWFSSFDWWEVWIFSITMGFADGGNINWLKGFRCAYIKN